MIAIKCPNCDKIHRVLKDRIPTPGARVRCSRCRHVFFANPKNGLVDVSKVDENNLQKAERANHTVTDVEKGLATQPKGMSFQQAFEILGLDADASFDGINESYVEVCAGCLQNPDDPHDRQRLAGRLYQINQAYETVLHYVGSRKASEEEACHEITRLYEAPSNTSKLGMSAPSQGTSKGHSEGGEVSDSKINTQGLFFVTYSMFFNHFKIFSPVIIKSSILVLLSSQLVNILMQMMPQFSKLITGHPMHSWIRVSVVYIIFGLLVSVLSTPVAATVFEYTIENNLIKKAYLSLLIDYRCLKIFTSYVFVGLLFIVSLMLFVVPSIVMIYHYAESVDIIMIIVILNIMLSLLILMLFTKRCLLFPYIAMNCGESLIDVFRNISHVRTADVFLIWFVNCPLIIFAIILKVLQKHFDSSLFFTFLDYLLSLNFVFMACMTALLLALFYVKKQHNREMLIMRKT